MRKGGAAMLGFGVFFAVSLLGAPLAAQDAQPDVFAAIIDVWPLDGEYDGYHCPLDLAEDEICLGSSILIQKGGLDRVISQGFSRADPRVRAAGKRDTDGQYLRFRIIGGHAARRIEAGRYLAVLEPTDMGYIFVQWRQEYTGGRACFPAAVVENYGDRLALAGAQPNEAGEFCVNPG